MTPLRRTAASGGKPLLLILLFCSQLQAAFLVGEGATGSSFLNIPISARASGMAGAFTAINGDVSALEYNPAGLSEIYRLDATATMIQYIEESELQSFSIGAPLDFKKGPNLGDGFFGPDSDKVFFGFQYRSFQADDTTRDSLGVPLGEFDIKDQLFQAGLAYAPFERLSLGLAGKSISSKLGSESMTNLAFDAGVLWKLTGVVTAGASILNMGQDKAFISEPDPLPTTLRTGLGFQFRRTLLTVDVFSGRDKITKEAMGFELSPNRILRLRGGLVNGTDLEYAGGVGLMFTQSQNKVAPKSDETGKKKTRSVLDDLGPSNEETGSQKFVGGPSKPMDFGIDYSIRSHTDLDLSHTFTLKILY